MPVLTRLIPAPVESRDTDAPGTREWLGDLYVPAARSFLRLNFVASVNGSVVGVDGTSESLSSRVDRMILGVLRRNADVVLVGARTVRREGYVSPASSRLAIVTRSGDLTGARFDGATTPPIVLCPATAAARVEEQLGATPHEVLTLTDETMDPAEVRGLLADRDLPGIVCEGGPTLAAHFVDAGLVDELCLTTSPKLRAPGVPLFPRLAETVPARLTSLLADSDGYLYARWALSARD